MVATFGYSEDNGVQTGAPLKGTTRTAAVVQSNWKAVDDVATAYGSSPITAGNNSMSKYQFGAFTGTFNQISAGLWAHTAGICGTGVTLFGAVTTTYATPAVVANAALADKSAVTAIASGAAVLFSTVGPEGASPTATLAAAGFTQYLVSQLRTTVSAAQGDTAVLTTTLQYNEN